MDWSGAIDSPWVNYIQRIIVKKQQMTIDALFDFINNDITIPHSMRTSQPGSVLELNDMIRSYLEFDLVEDADGNMIVASATGGATQPAASTLSHSSMDTIEKREFKPPPQRRWQYGRPLKQEDISDLCVTTPKGFNKPRPFAPSAAKELVAPVATIGSIPGTGVKAKPLMTEADLEEAAMNHFHKVISTRGRPFLHVTMAHSTLKQLPASVQNYIGPTIVALSHWFEDRPDSYCVKDGLVALTQLLSEKEKDEYNRNILDRTRVAAGLKHQLSDAERLAFEQEKSTKMIRRQETRQFADHQKTTLRMEAENAKRELLEKKQRDVQALTDSVVNNMGPGPYATYPNIPPQFVAPNGPPPQQMMFQPQPNYYQQQQYQQPPQQQPHMSVVQGKRRTSNSLIDVMNMDKVDVQALPSAQATIEKKRQSRPSAQEEPQNPRDRRMMLLAQSGGVKPGTVLPQQAAPLHTAYRSQVVPEDTKQPARSQHVVPAKNLVKEANQKASIQPVASGGPLFEAPNGPNYGMADPLRYMSGFDKQKSNRPAISMKNLLNTRREMAIDNGRKLLRQLLDMAASLVERVGQRTQCYNQFEMNMHVEEMRKLFQNLRYANDTELRDLFKMLETLSQDAMKAKSIFFHQQKTLGLLSRSVAEHCRKRNVQLDTSGQRMVLADELLLSFVRCILARGGSITHSIRITAKHIGAFDSLPPEFQLISKKLSRNKGSGKSALQSYLDANPRCFVMKSDNSVLLLPMEYNNIDLECVVIFILASRMNENEMTWWKMQDAFGVIEAKTTPEIKKFIPDVKTLVDIVKRHSTLFEYFEQKDRLALVMKLPKAPLSTKQRAALIFDEIYEFKQLSMRKSSTLLDIQQDSDDLSDYQIFSDLPNDLKVALRDYLRMVTGSLGGNRGWVKLDMIYDAIVDAPSVTFFEVVETKTLLILFLRLYKNEFQIRNNDEVRLVEAYHDFSVLGAIEIHEQAIYYCMLILENSLDRQSAVIDLCQDLLQIATDEIKDYIGSRCNTLNDFLVRHPGVFNIKQHDVVALNCASPELDQKAFSFLVQHLLATTRSEVVGPRLIPWRKFHKSIIDASNDVKRYLECRPRFKRFLERYPTDFIFDETGQNISISATHTLTAF